MKSTCLAMVNEVREIIREPVKIDVRKVLMLISKGWNWLQVCTECNIMEYQFDKISEANLSKNMNVVELRKIVRRDYELGKKIRNIANTHSITVASVRHILNHSEKNRAIEDRLTLVEKYMVSGLSIYDIHKQIDVEPVDIVNYLFTE